jgi:hypothetical protein
MATEQDNVNSGALGTLVAVGTIAFLGIALVVTALVRAELAEELEKKEVAADRVYRDLVAEQTAKLNAQAAYSDRARGLVALPIDRAMELTVAGLVKDPNSATPTAGGAPSTAAGGSGGAAGAATDGADQAAKNAKQPEGVKPAPAKKAPPKKEAPSAPQSPAAPAPVKLSPSPAAPAPAPNGQ